MALTINADCTVLTFASENGYVEDIVNPPVILTLPPLVIAEQCKYTLEVGTNCCTPTLEFTIGPRFPFGMEYSCTFGEINPTEDYYDIVITGFSALLVSEIELLRQNPALIPFGNDGFAPVPSAEGWTYSIVGSTLTINNLGGGNGALSGTTNFKLLITTTCGVVYTLSFTLEKSGSNCDGVITLVDIDYGDPVGFSINGSLTPEIELTPEILGLSSETFPDGIYYVGLTQHNIYSSVESESYTTLVDCETTCKVIDVLADDLCSEIFLLLEALKYSFNCDTITYEQQCDLWYVIAKQLGYFVNSPCLEPKTSCGTCNK